MDFTSILQMLIPVGVNILGGVVASIGAGVTLPDLKGGAKQLVVIGLCLGASVGNMYISGKYTGIPVDFSTTEGTFGTISTLLVLAAAAWTASQAFYYKVIKKD